MTTAADAILRHEAELRAWLTRLLGAVDADEAFSETSIRVVQGFDRFSGDVSKLRSWIFRIARNEGYRLLERRRRIRTREQRFETGDASVLPRPGPGASTQLREADLRQKLREGIEALLNELEPEDAALLVLRFQEGWSCPKIAEYLSAPPHDVIAEATIRKRVSRLTKRLKDRADVAGLRDLAQS